MLRPGEEERLREIAAAAKGYWGYDPEVVRVWAAGIRFDPPGQQTYVADSSGEPIAWAAVEPKAEVVWLGDMWVEPGWIGKGVGSLLFRRCEARARELGATRLEWEAEPNAVGFYERMGGRYLRDSEPSEWGRALPVMGLELALE